MKTKVKRLSKRTLAVFLGVMMLVTSIGIGSLITVNADTTFYYDFRNVTGGVNYYNNGNLQYDESGGGKIITGTLPTDNNTVIAKTQTGDWTGIKRSEIPSGKNMIVFNSDGKTFTTTTNYTAKPTYAVTAKSNKNSWGTVSVDSPTAYQGKTVTVNVNTASGSFKSISAKDADGATVTLTTVTEGSKYTFSMPAKAVTVTATFEEYVGVSNFYYNGYEEGGSPKSGYYGKQMTEGKLNGKTYSYYHVQGRTEEHQLFTVSYGNPDYTDCYVYWTRPSDWGETWSNWDKQYAMFYSSDEVMIQDWTNMDGVGDTTGGYKFKTLVPDGARYVRFKDGKYQSQTVLIDLNNGGNNGFYLSGGKDGNDYKVSSYDNSSSESKVGDVYEYYNGENIYTDNYNTKGFNNHNSNRGGSHLYTKPKDLNSSSDYYILLFYKDTEYTYNNVTRKNTDSIEVVWASELPRADDEDGEHTANVYAKDGTKTLTEYGFAKIGTTTIESGFKTTPVLHDDTSANNQDYYTCKVLLSEADENKTLSIKTVIDSSYRNRYFVKGWCVNGETIGYNVNDTLNADGVYTVNIPLPYEDYKDANNIEITPIYYTKDQSKCISFTVEGFDDTVKAAYWGDTLYAYPFYGSLSNVQNSYGAYPGQPMVYYQGKYSIQIPIESIAIDASNTDGTYIRGITLNNGWEDAVHCFVSGWSSSDRTKHKQTYDFDDFYKIYEEKNATNIIFRFKYRGADKTYNKDTYNSKTFLTTDDINTLNTDKGWELLRDRANRIVDIFGNPIKDSQGNFITDATKISNLESTALRVVSMGYFDNNAGEYATEWNIYKKSSSNYSRIQVSDSKHSIVPSALLLNDEDSFDNYTTYRNKPVSDFKDMYKLLKSTTNALGVPAYVAYEKDQVRDNNAVRCDGRWYYTTANDYVQSRIKIQYKNQNATTWSNDTYASSEVTDVTGVATGAKAYFTNEAYENKRLSNSEIYSTNASDNYKFTAKSSDNYSFVGWFFEYDGDSSNPTYIPIGTDADAEASRTSNDVIVARFEEVKSGTLRISHEVKNDATYKGTGKTYTKVEIYNGDTLRKTFAETTDDITINDSYIKATRGSWKIKVTLRTEPALDNTFNNFESDSSSLFFTTATSSEISAKTKVIEFTVNDVLDTGKKAIQYYSLLTPYIHKYNITYKYKSTRLNADQEYNKVGTFTETAYSNNVTIDGSTRTVSRNFIKSMAPYESNFKQILSVDDSSTITQYYSVSGSVGTHTITVTFTAKDNKDITGIFHLPYKYDPKSTESAYAANSQYEDYSKTSKYSTEDTISKADGILEDPSTEAFNIYSVYGGHFTTAENKVYSSIEAIKNDTTHIITAPTEMKESQAKEVTKYTLYKLNDKTVTWEQLQDQDPVKYAQMLATAKAGAGTTDETAAKAAYTYNEKVVYRISTETHYVPTGKTKYFQYWLIQNADREEIARCYYKDFNYLGFETYHITPIYSTEKPSNDEVLSTSISYLEESRNQWNNPCTSDKLVDQSDAAAADYIFVDFATSFHYNNIILKNYSGNVEVGVIVQRAGARVDGVTSSSDYKNLYKSSESDKSVLVGVANNSNTGKITGSDNKKYQKIQIPTSSLNNKNRLDYYLTVSNSYGWSGDHENGSASNIDRTYSQGAFRVYTYLKVDGKTVVSDTPAYFCTYGTANR